MTPSSSLYVKSSITGLDSNRRDISSTRRWKGWLAKKSLARTAFWLLANCEIRGISSSATSGATTESFIGTNTLPAGSFLSRSADARDAVVWAPFTIWRSVALVIWMAPRSSSLTSTADAVAAVGATSVKEMGKVMSVLMPQVQGRADGKLVSQMVREALGQQ